MDDAETLNLSGAWGGLYSYPMAREPVPFTATLTEHGGWLTGATEETATAGQASGQTITATLQGRRSASAVTFLKSYDIPPAHYDTVHYAGSVNHDGTEIEGTWTVPGSWSGKFLMVRISGVAAVLDLEVAARN